ncbi:hypothetical protein OIU85_019713 [Salix viminalis]|uniref:GATA-type domain-containing protein n=1 Tax=Salix viminalis TaxID=40686 RepID=A0A9Q0ZKE0_SALVM|nr:hypothetical protein OIU85_019713 [Salix viminalis]
MDLKGRKSSREDDRSCGGVSGEVEDKKACTDCKTTKTPLWRGGPAGPKSLCNACGIRYRKKRTMMRLEKGSEKKRATTATSNTTTATDISTITTATTTNTAQAVSGNGLISESLRMSLMVLGEEMMLQRPSVVKKQRCQRKRKLREEEQAAFSLMALSCASVSKQQKNYTTNKGIIMVCSCCFSSSWRKYSQGRCDEPSNQVPFPFLFWIKYINRSKSQPGGIKNVYHPELDIVCGAGGQVFFHTHSEPPPKPKPMKVGAFHGVVWYMETWNGLRLSFPVLLKADARINSRI